MTGAMHSNAWCTNTSAGNDTRCTYQLLLHLGITPSKLGGHHPQPALQQPVKRALPVHLQ